MAKISQRSGAAATAMLGLGVYRPERVVTNDEICEVLDSSDEWIQSRSGIRTRRYAAEDETLVEMATRAALAALDASGVGADELGARDRRDLDARAAHTGRRTAGRRPAGLAGGVVRRVGGLRRVLPRPVGGLRPGPGRQRAPRPGDRGREAQPLPGPHRPRRPPSSSPTAPVRSWWAPADEAGIGPVAWGSDGSKSHVITQEPGCQDRRLRPADGRPDGGHGGLPVGAVRDGRRRP